MEAYSAACQWLRALAGGRQAAQAARVLAGVASWPAFRGNDRGKAWAEVIAAPGGELGQAVLTDCRASHDREATCAASQGLPPGS